MNNAIVQAFFSLIGSALGAAIASYFGVKFGLTKFVSERAFDRRLDWFERTMKTLNAVKYLNSQVIDDINLRNFSSLDVDSNEMVRKQEELVLHLSEAELFASFRAYDAARNLRHELSDRIHSDTKGRYSQIMNAEHKDEEQMQSCLKLITEMCEFLQPLYEQAADEIAKDIRTHLKLEPIKVIGKNETKPKNNIANTFPLS